MITLKKLRWNPVIWNIEIRKNGEITYFKVYDIGILQFNSPKKKDRIR